MTTALAFWDRIAPKYAAGPIRDMPAYEATLARVRGLMGPEDRVLELGCGTGGTALELAPGVAAYTATDISGAMIEIAREKAWDRGLRGLDFAQAAPGTGDLPHGPFDAVLAFNLLHLLPDLPRALREIADRMAPGGLFISKTPCISPLSPLRPLIAAMQLVGKAPPVTYFRPGTLRARLEAAGFEVIEATRVHPTDKRPFLVARRR